MFPDALHFRVNERQVGKVFAYELDGTVAMGARRTQRSVSASLDEWNDCLACPEFDHGYKFCVV